jgi:hypothetical protein
MSHARADTAFTPAVKVAQQRDGSRAAYAGGLEGGATTVNHELGRQERDFVSAQRS